MAKVVVVTSGKGGVGKTTSTAALGAALARSGNGLVGPGGQCARGELGCLAWARRRGTGHRRMEGCFRQADIAGRDHRDSISRAPYAPGAGLWFAPSESSRACR